jgi:hypothetical protein
MKPISSKFYFWLIALIPLTAACSKSELLGYPHSLKPGELMPYLKDLTWTNPKCLEEARNRKNIKCKSFFDGYIYHYGHKLAVGGIISYEADLPNYHWLVSWHHSGTNPDKTGALGQCTTAPRIIFSGDTTYCSRPPS